MVSSIVIKRIAAEVGFDICGVTRSRHLAENEAFFRRWLDEGHSAGLDYLQHNLDKRFDTSRLVDGARSVIVCAVNYKNRFSDGYPEGFRTKIASYACNRDYHKSLKKMLQRMFALLQEEFPGIGGRVFTDSAPLLEKQLAVEAGLGWIGRQSLLVTPQYGTFVLLGEIVIDDDADAYDSPVAGVHCGECRRCVDACPNGAILPDRCIDASRCISCATIENAAPASTGLAGWVFGCDECQSCCPYNRNTPYHRNTEFDPKFDPTAMTCEQWLGMGEEEFARRFAGTPLMRSGSELLRRNVLRNLSED